MSKVSRGMDSYPFVRCGICGADIAKRKDEGPKTYQKRKTCRLSDNPQCQAMHMQNVNKGRKKASVQKRATKTPTYKETESVGIEEQKQTAKNSKERAKKLEKERKDAIEYLDKKYGPDRITYDAYSLDEQTRRNLEKVYTPPGGYAAEVLPSYERERPYSGGLVPRNAGSNI